MPLYELNNASIADNDKGPVTLHCCRSGSDPVGPRVEKTKGQHHLGTTALAPAAATDSCYQVSGTIHVPQSMSQHRNDDRVR